MFSKKTKGDRIEKEEGTTPALPAVVAFPPPNATDGPNALGYNPPSHRADTSGNPDIDNTLPPEGSEIEKPDGQPPLGGGR